MIVESTALTKSYGTTTVLQGVDLHVREGTVFALLGPNGAGKTTAIRILTTLTRPDGGTARVAGHDVVREPAKVRASISLTGQYAAVDAQQTGRENLTMIGRLMHLGPAAGARAVDLLERFDLREAADRRVATYSGGMRRRLDLAMSLVARPRVIFLDEPTTGLDPTSRTTMWDSIKELVATGTTIVLTTQYLEEADRLADDVALLHEGRIALSGTPDEVKAHVGGHRLDLRFTTETARIDAAALFQAPAPGDDPLLLGLPSDGTATHLHHVLDALRTADVPVAAVSSHRPTLDDVFLAVTTRPREEAR